MGVGVRGVKVIREINQYFLYSKVTLSDVEMISLSSEVCVDISTEFIYI